MLNNMTEEKQFDEHGKGMKIAKLCIPRTYAKIYRELLYRDSYDGCRGIIKPLDGILKGDGSPKISYSTVRRYWPNWVRPMIEADKEFCCCHNCHFSGQIHQSVMKGRAKLIKTKCSMKKETRMYPNSMQHIDQYEKKFFSTETDGKYVQNLYHASLSITCKPFQCINLNSDKSQIKQTCAEGICVKCPRYE